MLNANEARRMTGKALGPDAEAVRPYLEIIDQKVKSMAAKGGRQITNPLHCPATASGQSPEPCPPDVREAVRKAVEAEGYGWIDHPDPDPGHPCSSPYISISW